MRRPESKDGNWVKIKGRNVKDMQRSDGQSLLYKIGHRLMCTILAREST